MTGFGFTEAINYSFIHNRCCDQLQLGSDDPRRRMLNVLNPLAEDQSVMRTSLIPGLLETMRRNISQQVRTVKVFEIGKTFIGCDLLGSLCLQTLEYVGFRHSRLRGNGTGVSLGYVRLAE